MMGNRRLRQLNALFDVSATKAPSIALRFPALGSILQHLQNPASSRIGDGMQRPVKQFVGGHSKLQIPAKLMNVNVMNADYNLPWCRPASSFSLRSCFRSYSRN